MALKVLPYCRGSDLSSLIRDLLSGSNQDTVRFLVPSRKDRDWWLRRAGQDQFGPTGRRSIPWTWQELYDDLCASMGTRRRRPLSPPDHLLILRCILDEVLDEEHGLTEHWPGLRRSGFLDVLSDDVHELLNEAVRPEQMEDPDDQNNPIKRNQTATEETARGPAADLLPRVYRRYLAYLDGNGLLDSAQICSATAELLAGGGDWGRNFTLVFTGFLSFTHSQLELVRALISRSRDVVILKPETQLSELYDVAGQLALYSSSEVRASDSSFTGGQIIEFPAAEPGLEPESVARRLALWAAGQLPVENNEAMDGDLSLFLPFPGFSNIGIMTSNNVAETMISALKRYAIPFNQETGKNISQTLPGQILASVRSLSNSGFPTYGMALLLAQPCFAGAKFSTANALRSGPVGLRAWEEYLSAANEDEPIQSARRAIRAIGSFCRAIARGGRPEELMDAFYKFLTTKGLWLDRMETANYEELDESIRTIASAIETVKEKSVTLHELLPDLGPLGQNKFKGERAFNFLETWCRQSNTRPPLSLSGAVHLYAGQPPVLASHPVWFMLDVTQRTWPGRIPSSPLLSTAERERLKQNGAHLPSAHDKAMQREALFRRLVQTGEDLTVLSCSNLDENDRPLARSPFIERFQTDMRYWDLKTLSTTPIEVLNSGDGILFSGIDPDSTIVERTPPVFHDAGEIVGLGVSDLKELLSCPALWWLRRRGRIRERTVDLTTMADWGTLSHVLWQEIWLKFRESCDPTQFSSFVHGEWARLLSGDGPYDDFRRLTRDPRLQRRLENQHYRILRMSDTQERILKRLYQFGFQHKMIRLEEEAQLKLERGGIAFTGQCDRIEVFEEKQGGFVAIITDYKEGRAEKYEKGMSIKSCPWNIGEWEKFRFGLQLSAYAVMFEQQYPNIPLAGVSFLGLDDGRLAGSFTPELQEAFAPESVSKKKLDIPLQERKDEAEYAMQCAASLLRSGKFSPFYGSELCRTCGMKSICRRSEFCSEFLLEDENNEGEESDI
ncbi:MAG: PD-(D/E)XK nuclease family protein [Fretibacterium sp.]|nr:PD-(D/E)XK nuclease family protein [Fretibacterium sp.]